MYNIRPTTKFQKDLKRVKKRGFDISLLTDIIKKLADLFGCKVSALISDEKNVPSLNIAFRTNALTCEDLKSIAMVNRIALNLESMQEMSKVD